MKRLYNISVLCAALLTSQYNLAANDEFGSIDSGFYLAPSVAYAVFDDDYNIDDAGNAGVAMGYRFNRAWALELQANQADTHITEKPFNDMKVSVQNFSLDAVYQFENFSDRFNLYMPFGVGKQRFKVDDYDGYTETTLNTGIGLRYQHAERIFLRTELRGIYGDEDDSVNTLISLALVYQFGQAHKSVQDSSDDMASAALDHEQAFPQQVLFASAESSVNSSDKQQLHDLGQAMQRHDSWQLRLHGHTDDIGSVKDNQRLGLARAMSVKDSVVAESDIAESRIILQSFGELKPQQSNDSEYGRQVNRRVEIELLTD
ncbi:MAG: OmpA family protein [Pseudomonadales bacterium]|nr:OmpA family protein [Pseudomonadales bacterium]